MPKSTNKAELPTSKKLYNELKLENRSGKNAITRKQMEKLLGWEVEPEPDKFGDDFLLTDMNDNNIRCSFNLNNRPFDYDRALRYAYTILQLDWAGPLVMPGDTVNGETMVWDWYGQCRSGQHRGIGHLLACQIWEQDRAEDGPKIWQKNWPKEPVLETLAAFGISNNPRVIRTLDCVKERTGADTMYSTGMYEGKTADEREYLCKITDAAVRFLWVRTGANRNETTPYRTQTEIEKFVVKHPALKKVAMFVMKANSAGKLGFFLPPGYVTAALYLMGAAKSDREKYKKSMSEKDADMGLLKKAEQFWTEVGAQSGSFKAVAQMKFPQNGDLAELDRTAEVQNRKPHKFTGHLFGPDGMRNLNYRLIGLAKAWNLFIEGGALTDKTLRLDWEYAENDDKPPTVDELDGLLSDDTVGGIEWSEEEEEVPTETGKGGKTPKGDGGAGKLAMQADLNSLRSEHPGRLLVFRTSTEEGATYKVWGKDTAVFEKILNIEASQASKTELPSAKFGGKDFPVAKAKEMLSKLQKAGQKVALVIHNPTGEEDTVKYLEAKE